MATSLDKSENEDQIDHLHPKRFHTLKRFEKIGPVDPEIIVLRVIIKKDKERKKLTQAKYISRSASVPSGLKIKLMIK